MKLLVYSFSALAMLAVPASAQPVEEPIEERQAIMEERSDILQILGPIALEREPFDAEAVMAALEQLNENAQRTDIEALFPPGSHEGDTRASPAIWENWEEFTAIAEKFKADAAAAVEANPQDLESFQTVFGPLASNCGTCHERFRLEEDE